MLGAILLLLTTSSAEAFPTQGASASHFLDRWIHRLETRVLSAHESGALGEEKYRYLMEKVDLVETMREEALQDNLVTPKEREAIHHMIGLIDIEIAEARFGPKTEVSNRSFSDRPLVPREYHPPPREENGENSAR